MFDSLSKRLSGIFSTLTGKSHLTEKNMAETIDQIRSALLQADVPFEVVEQFIADVKKDAVGTKINQSLKPGEQLLALVHKRVKDFLGTGSTQEFTFQLPATIMMMGLQGSGKTTTIAKCARYVQKQAKKRGKTRRILLASIDFYRPAAVKQLEILAQTVGVSFYRSEQDDPIKAAQDIQQYARDNRFELLFLDTAGRLHIEDALINELQSVDKFLKPRYKFLVLDAMTGQQSLAVAKSFEQSVGFTGAILSKMDSDTRGGAAFAFRYALDKQILFVGTGEKPDDFSYFYPDRMANRIIGMGDLESLAEQAQEKIDQSEQESLYGSLQRGHITLADFAQMNTMVSRLGSFSHIAKFMPGMGNMNISPEDLERGDQEMKRMSAIIASMTPKERIRPAVLDASRKLRVAKGAGVGVSDVNSLLKKFEQSKQYVKLLKNMRGAGKGFFR